MPFTSLPAMTRVWFGGLAILWSSLVGCVRSESLQCSENLVCPKTQLCDLVHTACVDEDQLSACAGAESGTACSATTVPEGTCDQGVCLPARCGDGIVQRTEECDVDNAGSKTCIDLGYYDPGEVACASDCRYVRSEAESGCTGYCGDGEVRVGKELCDGNTPPLSCTDLGYGAGYLRCSAKCGPGLEDCKRFGWAQLEMPSRMADVHGTSDDNVFAVSNTRPDVQYFDGLSWTAVDVTGCALGATKRFTNVWTVGSRAAFATVNTSSTVVQMSATGCISHALPSAVNDVWGASATDVYVAADDGIHHYDGAAWSVVSGVARDRIWGAAANDIWAGGPSGALVHFDGTNWNTAGATLPGITQVTALWGTGPTDVFAAGSGSGLDRLYRYNGTTWSEIYNATGVSGGIRSITRAHGHPIIAVGSKVLSYNGAVWTTLQPGVFSSVLGLWTAPLSQKIYAGVLGAPFLLAFDGAARFDMPAFGPGNRIAIKSESEIYVVHASDALNGSLYLWDGTAWTDETNAGGNVDDVWVDPTGVVRIIDGGSQAVPAGGIRKRTGVNTWSTVAGSTKGSKIWGGSATDYWTFSGDDTNGYTLRHYVNDVAVACTGCPAASNSLRDLYGTSTSNVFAVGLNGLILRYNGTSVVTMQSGTTEDLLAVHASPDNQHVWAGGYNGALLHLVGQTWEVVPPPSAASPISAIWGTSPNDLFVGELGFMYHFDGSHWSPVASGVIGTVDEIESIGDSIFYVDSKQQVPQNPTMHQLVRIAPW
jgi:hypothetical protein